MEELGYGYSGGLSDEDMYFLFECLKVLEEYFFSDGLNSNDEDYVVEENVKKMIKRVVCRCLLEGCKLSVIYFFWYLREVYKWIRERVNKVIFSFGIRKSFFLKFLLLELFELLEKIL